MASSSFVTAKDQVKNAFTITVHKVILVRFSKAIRHRQIVLSQFGIPADIVELVCAGHTAASTTISQDMFETLAYCFYHFITFEHWEADRSVKVWELHKSDFEDNMEKRVTCYLSKLAVCNHSIVVRATIGFRVLHTAVWCCPSGAVENLLVVSSNTSSSSSKMLAVIQTSEKKVVMENEDTLRGTWAIRVTVSRPDSSLLGAAASYSARQLSDVADFRVTIKPRHDLTPIVVSYLAKLPSPVARRGGLELDEDDVEDLEEAAADVEEDHQLFSVGALRFSPSPSVLRGVLDPAPLPRDPTTYSIPNVSSLGPTIPPYTPYNLGSPRVVEGGMSSFDITPVGLKSNQSIDGRTVQRGGEDVPTYTQFIDLTFQVLNKTDKPLVFSKTPTSAVYRHETNGSVGLHLAANTTRWMVGAVRHGDAHHSPTVEPHRVEIITARCEFEIVGRACGSGYFERSLLDGTIFPQPALIRVTLEEAHSREHCTLEFEQYNKDRGLDTRESFLKSVQGSNYKSTEEDVLLYVSADDTDLLCRSSVAVFMETDGNESRMVVARRSYHHFLTLLRLHAAAYECLMSGKDMSILTDVCDGEHIQAWLCASTDVHPLMIYAIKIEVKTPTSSTVGYCHVKFQGKRGRWIATAAPKPEPGAPTSVAGARDLLLRSGSAAPVFVPAPEQKVHALHECVDPPSLPPTSFACRSSSSTSMGYRIHYDHPVGSGAYGAVFKAFDLQNGRTVAVKETNIPGSSLAPRLLQPPRSAPAAVAGSSDTSNSSSSSSSTKEFDVLISLSHPNIVVVYELDVVPEARVLRVFMEWVTGGSVASVLRQQNFRLHENVLRKYARDALRGLAYLHGKGILHLDVKPANMLVTHEGCVKLGDFGTTMFLSKATGTVTGQVAGTPAYMAPEIMSSGKFYRGSDVWAWACSVVEMATGNMPWSHLPEEKHSQLPLMFHIATSKPPHHCPLIPEHLSSPLREILTACFSPSLSLRPSAEALLETDYFARDTLPLDVEDIESYYQEAQEAKPLQQGPSNPPVSCTSSWLSAGGASTTTNGTF